MLFPGQSEPSLLHKCSSSYPIGIFDSGVGGLTVLRELRKQLPHESVVYFADTARLPYGSKSPTEIIEFVYQILTWMRSQQVKMVIMACNTSSALALDILRPHFDFPVLGLILPGARAAVKHGKHIGVIATEATVKSNAYAQAMQETQPNAKIWQIACPEFVPLIEGDRLADPYTIQVASNYLEPLIQDQIDTLVFGCTHYPHLKGLLSQVLPYPVNFINPAAYVVKAAVKELEILGLRHTNLELAVNNTFTRFYVSGDPQQFAKISSRWLNKMPSVEQVNLSHVELLS
ncbi:glutamate racemase [Thalassoporum mexicanum PCC 7367]|uniref:glutamate racemase n=1 Tax=Thalassoporum mexicanum TaxID=3457544 RepID=UPI00029F8FFC|nr:glutamate racemase [Pseudanabaena sp. PCC 7367]AFY70367.1 glutamate racemase [Pseudanabaena sp. PCC 7367]